MALHDGFEYAALARAIAVCLAPPLPCARIAWTDWMSQMAKTMVFCRMCVGSYCCSMLFDKKAFACEGFLADWDAISCHCC